MPVVNTFRAKLGVAILREYARQFGGTIKENWTLDIPKDKAGQIDVTGLVDAVVAQLYNHSQEARDLIAKIDRDDPEPGTS